MRILIADDHGIVRQGLRSLIQTRLNHEVIGEAEDGVAAVRMAGELRPEVVIMDVTMPNLNGIEATRLIRKQYPQVKVIALSMHPEKHIVKEALEAGASAYVLKSYLFDDLSKAIDAVAAGRRYLSPKITDVVLEDYISSTDQQQAKAKLSTRDRQIIQMLAEGKSIKQIAMALHISPKTADAARRKIMQKVGVTSVAELVKFAVREGITSLEF